MAEGFLSLPGLPGSWQFWGDAEGAACWLAPADAAAEAVVASGAEGVRVASGFLLAPKRQLLAAESRQAAPLF